MIAITFESRDAILFRRSQLIVELKIIVLTCKEDSQISTWKLNNVVAG